MKKLIVALIAISMMLVMTSTVTAVKPVQHVYLYEKDPSTWEIIEDGAWGKLTVNDNKNMFVFNGHNLEPGTEYTLINYYEVWSNPITLGTGTANEFENVHIMGEFPATFGYHYYPWGATGDYQGITGAKIWLIPDFTGNLVYPFPDGWLFENSLLLE